jgi:hypothetical protein
MNTLLISSDGLDRERASLGLLISSFHESGITGPSRYRSSFMIGRI